MTFRGKERKVLSSFQANILMLSAKEWECIWIFKQLFPQYFVIGSQANKTVVQKMIGGKPPVLPPPPLPVTTVHTEIIPNTQSVLKYQSSWLGLIKRVCYSK